MRRKITIFFEKKLLGMDDQTIREILKEIKEEKKG